MKFYPKLQVYKTPNGNNLFDGKRAYSYRWYNYAIVIDDHTIAVCDSYSQTTSQHMRNFESLFSGATFLFIDTDKQSFSAGYSRISESLINKIHALEIELLNPRNKARERRLVLIEKCKEQISYLNILKEKGYV